MKGIPRPQAVSGRSSGGLSSGRSPISLRVVSERSPGALQAVLVSRRSPRSLQAVSGRSPGGLLAVSRRLREVSGRSLGGLRAVYGLSVSRKRAVSRLSPGCLWAVIGVSPDSPVSHWALWAVSGLSPGGVWAVSWRSVDDRQKCPSFWNTL
jgi:hypothetical protein